VRGWVGGKERGGKGREKGESRAACGTHHADIRTACEHVADDLLLIEGEDDLWSRGDTKDFYIDTHTHTYTHTQINRHMYTRTHAHPRTHTTTCFGSLKKERPRSCSRFHCIWQAPRPLIDTA
jgi:hypothetical protein